MKFGYKTLLKRIHYKTYMRECNNVMWNANFVRGSFKQSISSVPLVRLGMHVPPGELERLQKFWLAGSCKKNEAKGESSKPLGILNFTSAFILLACGMVLGTILMIIEHIYFRFFRAKLRKWDSYGCCSLVSLVRYRLYKIYLFQKRLL